jgi:F-type H+-transporting ATPase subunit b
LGLGAAWVGALGLAGSAGASEGGFQLFPEPDKLLPLLVLFLLLIAPLRALLFRPLLGVLDARLEHIQGARRRAGELADESRQLAENHARVLREVRDEAEQERKQRVDEAKRRNGATLAEARAAAEAEVEQARREVRSATERARGALRDEARGLGQTLAERLLGRDLP